MLCLMNNANDDFSLRKKVLDRLKTDDKEIIAIRQNSNLAERERKLYNSEARELRYGKALIINQENYDSACRPHYENRHGSHEDEIQLAKVRFYHFQLEAAGGANIFGILFNAFLETFLQCLRMEKSCKILPMSIMESKIKHFVVLYCRSSALLVVNPQSEKI